MDQETLDKLHNKELEIMLALREFCDKFCIDYSLGSGTAIGAIRHKGFIPWDDDVDIAMTRSNFVKFCEAWKKEPLKGYYLDFFLYTNQTRNNHAKIRKDNTVFISEGDDESFGHNGIWVDIFPMDKASKDPKQREKLIRAGRRIILLTRASVYMKNESLQKKIVRHFFRCIPEKARDMIIRNAYNTILENDRVVKDNYEWVSMSCFESQKIMYPAENQTGYKYLEFCGHQFKAFVGIEKNLRRAYGDFMQLPPIEERVNTHHPIKVEFDKADGEIL